MVAVRIRFLFLVYFDFSGVYTSRGVHNKVFFLWFCISVALKVCSVFYIWDCSWKIAISNQQFRYYIVNILYTPSCISIFWCY